MTFGTSRYIGRIHHANSYLAAGGVELTLDLLPLTYRVAAHIHGTPIPVETISGSVMDSHHTGASLQEFYATLGAQNGADGRGSLCWDRIQVDAATSLANSLHPTPTILLPRINAEYVQGETVMLQGGSSTQGGTSVTSYVWHAASAGYLGSGSNLSVVLASAGAEEIHLSVANDSGGAATTSTVVWVHVDADGNGLPDTWEQQYWPAGGSGGSLFDSDADRASNWDEWIAGTNPTNDTSYLRFDDISLSADGSRIVVQWAGRSNRPYAVDAAMPLDTGTFTNLSTTPPSPHDQPLAVSNTIPAATTGQFRLRIPR